MYEVIYEELYLFVYLFLSIVNVVIGDCLLEGYEIDFKKFLYSIICVVVGATAFMFVVEYYCEKLKYFVLYKVLSVVV